MQPTSPGEAPGIAAKIEPAGLVPTAATEPEPKPRHGSRAAHRIRVAVVFGGRSTEHAISCVTAGSVLGALDRDRYDVVAIGITREGRWVLETDDALALAIEGNQLPEVSKGDVSIALSVDPTARELIVHEAGSIPMSLGEVDVVLPLLHGPYGEDGTLQGLLELAGVPYVGSGVFASAAAMDKHYMKMVLTASGLPDVPHVVVKPREWETDPSAVRESVASLGFPVFVKPARGGSSIGISKVHDIAELDAAIDVARESDPKVIVEAMVEGREIEVGVLEGVDGAGPDVSVPAEIVVRGKREFYDFDAKYLDGGDEAAEVVVPAKLPEATVAEIHRLAVWAFEALSCEGLARVDFFVTADHRVIVNEVNTMPGFTPTSVFPRVWAASGLDYPALIDRLIHTALRRRPGLR